MTTTVRINGEIVPGLDLDDADLDSYFNEPAPNFQSPKKIEKKVEKDEEKSEKNGEKEEKNDKKVEKSDEKEEKSADYNEPPKKKARIYNVQIKKKDDKPDNTKTDNDDNVFLKPTTPVRPHPLENVHGNFRPFCTAPVQHRNYTQEEKVKIFIYFVLPKKWEIMKISIFS